MNDAELINTWRPIETAPRDGSDFLVGRPRVGGTQRLPAIILARWSPIAKTWVEMRTSWITVKDEFAYWLPLPDPPASAMSASGQDAQRLEAKPASAVPHEDAADAQ